VTSLDWVTLVDIGKKILLNRGRISLVAAIVSIVDQIVFALKISSGKDTKGNLWPLGRIPYLKPQRWGIPTRLVFIDYSVGRLKEIFMLKRQRSIPLIYDENETQDSSESTTIDYGSQTNRFGGIYEDGDLTGTA